MTAVPSLDLKPLRCGDTPGVPGYIKKALTMDQQRTDDLQTSYTRVAAEYTRRIADELAHKLLDRQLLDRLAERVRGLGPVCDMGCGPGHIARYLHERGVEVCGVDIAPGMVEQARQLNPEIAFMQGNMLALDLADEAWGGIAAFYSIIHLPVVSLSLRDEQGGN